MVTVSSCPLVVPQWHGPSDGVAHPVMTTLVTVCWKPIDQVEGDTLTS